jgi:hypothetical protein
VPERFEQARQGDDLVLAEVDRAVQLEPVDARSHVGSHRLDGPEGAPFRLHAPAFADELAHRGWKPGRRDGEMLPRVLDVPLAPESELRQPRQRGGFRRDVAANQEPPRRIERRGAGAGLDDVAAIVERDDGLEARRLRGRRRARVGPHADARPRRLGDDLELQLFGELRGSTPDRARTSSSCPVAPGGMTIGPEPRSWASHANAPRGSRRAMRSLWTM